jgi:glycosyltransferase involved in cell wall biosynthesis
LTGADFVVDAHTDLRWYWTRPRWLCRYLAKRALTTIVTNDHLAEEVRRLGGHSLVIADIPTSYPIKELYPVEGPFNILVVNSFSLDEPLGEIVTAAEGLGDVIFYVSGDPRYGRRGRPTSVPPNVRFTGFLPNERYYALMASSQAVICLTTQDHTMQRGAVEALSMGIPIVTSSWPLLQQYFCKGSVHVDNSAAGIRAGVLEIVRDHARYKAEIAQLQNEKRHEWQGALDSLVALVDRSVFDGAHSRNERGSTKGSG